METSNKQLNTKEVFQKFETAISKALKDVKSDTIQISGEVSELKNSKEYNGFYFGDIKDSHGVLNIKYPVELDLSVGDYGLFEGKLNSRIWRESDNTPTLRLDVENFVRQGNSQTDLLTESSEELTPILDNYFRPFPNIKNRPYKISIVSSLNAKGLKDVLHVFEETDLVEHQVFDCNLLSLESIMDAIKQADSSDCDVLLITRGGDKKENLKVFDDLKLVDLVKNCKNYIAVGIAHSEDEFLVEKVADLVDISPTGVADEIIKKIKNNISYEQIAIDSFLPFSNEQIINDFSSEETDFLDSFMNETNNNNASKGSTASDNMFFRLIPFYGAFFLFLLFVAYLLFFR